jgi:hypothetical protein
MAQSKLLNTLFIICSVFFLGRMTEQQMTWRRVKKFFPLDDGEPRLYKNTSEFLYGLFLSNAFVAGMQESLNGVGDTATLSDSSENITGMYL